MSAALLSAQGTTKTYRGCLVPGSSQGNYLLNSAVAKGDKTKTKVSLKVVPGSPKVNVEAQLTHEVEITGTVTEGSQGQPGTLTAEKISWKADYCG
jgi:hypothetical protein